MADWSSIPSEIVRLFADKLVVIEDFTSLSSVCRSFKAAADNDRRPTDQSSQPPWLLLCCPDIDGDADPPNNNRGIFSIYKNKKFYIDLPELYGRRCWGSPYGWIVTLGHDLKLHLFNPLNRRRIDLPEITCDNTKFDDEDHRKTWIRRYFIERAILIKRPPGCYSSSPGYDDFLVAVLDYDESFRVMRPRTNTWHTLKRPCGSHTGALYDIVSYQDKIYALSVSGRLMICSNLDGPDPPTAEDYVPPDRTLIRGSDKLYLVESRGELLLIVRCRTRDEQNEEQERYYTDYFYVYKLNHQSKKWIEVVDLEDRAFFVGGCQSVVLPSAEGVNCRSNCIYFADDTYDYFIGKTRGLDMGIFDFEEATVVPFCEGDDWLSSYSTPTWFTPSLA